MQGPKLLPTASRAEVALSVLEEDEPDHACGGRAEGAFADYFRDFRAFGGSDQLTPVLALLLMSSCKLLSELGTHGALFGCMCAAKRRD